MEQGTNIAGCAPSGQIGLHLGTSAGLGFFSQSPGNKPHLPFGKLIVTDRPNGATKSGIFSLLDGVNYWSFFTLF
ncbi:MAG: hypothetical protein FWF31_05010, partial [Desulfobulbus sp.]|nr:hypothetical protein [Desulfobulbus sp.]